MGLIPDSTPAGDAGTPDVSGASSTPDVSTETPSSDAGESTDVFADQDFDKAFGLQPEEKESDDTSDVTKAPETPAPRQDEEIEKDAGKPDKEPEAEGEVDETTPEAKATEAETPKTDGQFQPNEKLNWEDDKVPFRKEFQNLKQAYMGLLENSVESKFISDPKEFVSWMKEASDTSFREAGKLISTESATAHPKEWIDYLFKTNPDLMAEVVSGREGMKVDRLKAELDVLLDDDDEDVQAALEKRQAEKAGAEKPEETPEQKEIREWREERAREQQAKVVNEVFQPVEQAVDALVSEAGLEIKDAETAGKRFDELDEGTQFKAMVNSLIPVWIDHRVKQDPQLLGMQARLEQFLANGDVAGAKRLQHAMTIAATNFAGELLTLVTGQKAKAKQSATKIPAPVPPKPMVKSAGATNGFSPADGSGKELDWSADPDKVYKG